MSSKIFLALALPMLFTALAVSSSAQVVPAATEGSGWKLDAGAGVSDFHMDYGRGNEWGGTLWVDADINTGPLFLHGLGVEMEARDLSIDRAPMLPNHMRTDTAGGGPIYSWHHFSRVRPYGKYLVSFGNLDMRKDAYHFTSVLYSPGGGVEYRPFGHVWLRADYEYQIWLNLFAPKWNFDPQGVTVGAVYEFGHGWRH
jgi:opacity protein-like surface antigen